VGSHFKDEEVAQLGFTHEKVHFHFSKLIQKGAYIVDPYKVVNIIAPNLEGCDVSSIAFSNLFTASSLCYVQNTKQA
jgi:hypothetical protein